MNGCHCCDFGAIQMNMFIRNKCKWYVNANHRINNALSRLQSDTIKVPVEHKFRGLNTGVWIWSVIDILDVVYTCILEIFSLSFVIKWMREKRSWSMESFISWIKIEIKKHSNGLVWKTETFCISVIIDKGEYLISK